MTAAYRKLGCALEHVPPDDAAAELVRACVATTAGHTAGHTRYALEVEDVFAVRRDGEEERFAGGAGGRLGNHRLLWHGSRLTNWVIGD